MPTTIVSTQSNLQGNISSCNTNISILNGSSRPSLFYIENTGYATNNCTGKTDIYHSWELSGISILLIIMAAVLLFPVVFFVKAQFDL